MLDQIGRPTGGTSTPFASPMKKPSAARRAFSITNKSCSTSSTDTGSAPPRISFDKTTRAVLDLARVIQEKRRNGGQTSHCGLECCVHEVMTTSDCWPELRDILDIAESHGIDVEELRYELFLPGRYWG